MEQSYSIRINRIVLDFITDVAGKVWLFNCKSLRIDDKVYMQQQDQTNKVKKTLDDLTCSGI